MVVCDGRYTCLCRWFAGIFGSLVGRFPEGTRCIVHAVVFWGRAYFQRRGLHINRDYKVIV